MPVCMYEGAGRDNSEYRGRLKPKALCSHPARVALCVLEIATSLRVDLSSARVRQWEARKSAAQVGAACG